MCEMSGAFSKAISEFKDGNKRPFTFLINRVAHADDQPFIEAFLKECNQNYMDFPIDLVSDLVHVLLREKPWYKFRPEYSKQCLVLVVNMVVNNSELAPDLLSNFSEVFCFSESHFPVFGEFDYLDILVEAMRLLFEYIPDFESNFVANLRSKMPSWGADLKLLFVTVSNILRICSARPSFLSYETVQNLLSLCFKLSSDVEINVDMVPNYAANYEAFSGVSDLFSESKFEDNQKLLYKSVSVDTNKSMTLLWLLIVGLSRLYREPDLSGKDMKQKKRWWSHVCAVWRDLRLRFVVHMLPLDHEFVFFPLLLVSVSNLRPAISVSFVEALWRYVKETQTMPEVVRARALRMMADFLARSKLCSTEFVIEQLHTMASWCVEYTHFQRRKICADLQRMVRNHKIFYTVFESMIYVIIFRQSEIVGTSTGRHSTMNLPLIQLINSPFKPLDVIDSTLRSQFQAANRAYKMTWTTQIAFLDSFDPMSAPKPSFDCPLTNALSVLPPVFELNLLKEFAPAKRTLKRALSALSIDQSTDTVHSEAGQKPLKCTKQQLATEYFNFDALERLS